ncbi:GAF domain-containing sensor histidine kinase [Noviherbaspirillum galbum]|uniref:Histidine kinase n=1 Tax=Noviherbaspirillum galbum TaxID=2709383 RepID=A0A6B3SRJ6_9BURK|nr:histidine kinase [Noviherbaspirillum galbum]NEX61052.1 histidine kinase [Noviherbaspirillum galbum]
MPDTSTGSTLACECVDGERTLPAMRASQSDTAMVGMMRLVLATSMLMSVILDKTPDAAADWQRAVCAGYVAHAAALCLLAQFNRPLVQHRVVHWFDVAWFALIVGITGGAQSFFFLAFLFAILTSSFRWGFEEGGRITIASTVLFALPTLLLGAEPDYPSILMRSAFLLVLGYMSAYWGETKLELRRQLALLRDVSQLSNPRFGVDQTLDTVLARTRAFFQGSSCMLVVNDRNDGACSLRTVKEAQGGRPCAQQLDAPAGAPLLAPVDGMLVYSTSWLRARLGMPGSAFIQDAHTGKWTASDDAAVQHLADLLDARDYMCVPVAMRRGAGRLYVTGGGRHFGKADVSFLAHIAAQAFPVIENIELVDHMATEAAMQERKKIALDLHDTAIQPYVGLRLGLNALRRKATPDNPLIEDIDRLARMAAERVDDLRRYAGGVSGPAACEQSALSAALHRHAAQIKRFYGIDIAIQVDGDLKISDRLAAQALQLVSEGLSNICKHTAAQRGRISLRCLDGWLRIGIENDGAGREAKPFVPRSITERAAVLGGNASVTQGPDGAAAVQVDIPI